MSVPRSCTWTVTKAKLAGQTRVWRARFVGSDEHGIWLYAPAGTPNRTPAGQLFGTLSHDGVQLVPVDGWWVAWWWADGSITLDVTTPAVIDGPSVTYVDLELDLWANDGDHGLVDQDQYDAARTAGLISDEQDGPARAATNDLERQLAERVEPFGDEGWNWLSRSDPAS